MTGSLEPPDYHELDALDWLMRLHRDHGDAWVISRSGSDWTATNIGNPAAVLRAATAAELSDLLEADAG